MKSTKSKTEVKKADETQKSLTNKILKGEKKVKDNLTKKSSQEYDTTEKRIKTTEKGLLNTKNLKTNRK